MSLLGLAQISLPQVDRQESVTYLDRLGLKVLQEELTLALGGLGGPGRPVRACRIQGLRTRNLQPGLGSSVNCLTGASCCIPLCFPAGVPLRNQATPEVPQPNLCPPSLSPAPPPAWGE